MYQNGAVHEHQDVAKQEVELSRDIFKCFETTRTFNLTQKSEYVKEGGIDDGKIGNKKAEVESIAFHASEQLLAVATDDNVIRVYDTQKGVQRKTLTSAKYGVCQLNFTTSSNCLLYASNKETVMNMIEDTKQENFQSDEDIHAIRYHSIHDNSYLKYFRGHTDQVMALVTSQKSDQFLSFGADKMVRRWDFNSDHCQGVLKVMEDKACLACDKMDNMFVIGLTTGVIEFRNLDNHFPKKFKRLHIPKLGHSWEKMAHLKLSNDSDKLLVVAEGQVFVLDSSVKELKTKGDDAAATVLWSQHIGYASESKKVGIEASFTPDDMFVICGHSDKSLRIFVALTGEEVARLDGHFDIPKFVQWSPRHCLIASASSSELRLWQPNLEHLRKIKGYG